MIAFLRPGTRLHLPSFFPKHPNEPDQSCRCGTSEITIEDREALRRAVKSLEHPSLAARLTNLVGKPVELIGYALPSLLPRPSLPRPRRGSKPHSRSHCARSCLTADQLAVSASGACDGVGRCGRIVRARGTSGRTAGVDYHHAAVDRGHRAQRGRGPGRSGGCPLLRRGLRVGRAYRVGRRVGERLFRGSGHARQDGDGSRPLRRRTRRHQGGCAHPAEVRHPGRRTLRIGGHAEGRRAGPTGGRRPRRCGGQLCVHRAFPGCRARSFHGAAPRADLWQGEDSVRIQLDSGTTFSVESVGSTF